MSLKLRDVFQNIKEHFSRRLVGIDAVDQFFAVIIENRLALAFVGFLTRTNHIDVGIIEAILFERTALKSLNQIVNLSASKIKDGDYLESFFKDFRLFGVARNAIEDEC